MQICWKEGIGKVKCDKVSKYSHINCNDTGSSEDLEIRNLKYGCGRFSINFLILTLTTVISCGLSFLIKMTSVFLMNLFVEGSFL